MRFIDDSNIDNKKEYFDILKDFLSKKMLLILAFHLSNRDERHNKYIQLINDYQFLENFDLILLEVLFIRNIGISLGDEFLYESIYKFIVKDDFIDARNYVNTLLFDIYKPVIKFNGGEEFYDFEDDKVEFEYGFLHDFMIGKLEKKEDVLFNYIQNGKITRCKMSSLLFVILKTFEKDAFKGNIGYTNSHLMYKEFINYTHFKNNL